MASITAASKNENEKVFIELVGLIGAGKSSLLQKFRDGLQDNYPDLHVGFDIEDEEMLHEFILPLLTDVYKCVAGKLIDEEYLTEAYFALIRLLTLFIALRRGDNNGRQLSHNANEYADILLKRLRIRDRLDGDSSALENLRIKLGAFIQKKVFNTEDETRTLPTPFVMIDRGVIDVLCFITDRIESYDTDESEDEDALNSRKADMLTLFETIYYEILIQLFYGLGRRESDAEEAWRNIDLPKEALSHAFFGGILPFALDRCQHYKVYTLTISRDEAVERIKKRGRLAELEKGGKEVQPRVQRVNEALEKLYGEIIGGEITDGRLAPFIFLNDFGIQTAYRRPLTQTLREKSIRTILSDLWSRVHQKLSSG